MSSHIDIARDINGDGMGFLIIIRRPVVARNPLLLSRTVVLERRVIKPTTQAVTESRNIGIARGINGNGISIVIGIRRTIVTCDPLLLPSGIVLDRSIIITCL